METTVELINDKLCLTFNTAGSLDLTVIRALGKSQNIGLRVKVSNKACCRRRLGSAISTGHGYRCIVGRFRNGQIVGGLNTNESADTAGCIIIVQVGNRTGYRTAGDCKTTGILPTDEATDETSGSDYGDVLKRQIRKLTRSRSLSQEAIGITGGRGSNRQVLNSEVLTVDHDTHLGSLKALDTCHVDILRQLEIVRRRRVFTGQIRHNVFWGRQKNGIICRLACSVRRQRHDHHGADDHHEDQYQRQSFFEIGFHFLAPPKKMCVFKMFSLDTLVYHTKVSLVNRL